jgi:hypothetical protein
MDRITLVELIEGETARLSPRGRELWEEMEALVDLNPEEQDTSSLQANIVNRVVGLPQPEQDTLDRLMELRAGLYESDKAEERGESGERYRVRSVIVAAGNKARSEGRQADPPMTVGQAIARLRQ